MNKLPRQPQHQNSKRKQHHPLTPSITNKDYKDRWHHDRLGYDAPEARPSAQDGEGGSGDVEEEGVVMWWCLKGGG